MPDGNSGWSLRWRRLRRVVDPELTFRLLFGDRPCSFWLDSSLVEASRSHFSFLGESSGPERELLRYEVASGHVEAEDASGCRREIPGSIFEVLQQRIAERSVSLPPEMQFDFNGGYVGYLGYECKADCGAKENKHRSPLPDAVWMMATRIVAIDHSRGETWLLAPIGPDRDALASAESWLTSASSTLAQRDDLVVPRLDDAAVGLADGRPVQSLGLDGPNACDWRLEQSLARPRDRYLNDIATCIEHLHAGESYEICLTNTVELPFADDPFELYCEQRRMNPAPYATYLHLPEASVLCSSPERFLKVDGEGVAESCPIKGTSARQEDPRADAEAVAQLHRSRKAQAENLMIVDLVRNDLGRVCEIGSVTVPGLMAVESYATVHQLVSTIRGRLRSDVSAVDVARACFPPGSMTGAPKLRTMEIIDSLETQARGVYSGAIGFFALAGTADLNVVIRTIVIDGERLSVGAGGAIVLESDAEEEYEEMLLKASAALLGQAGPQRASANRSIPPISESASPAPRPIAKV